MTAPGGDFLALSDDALCSDSYPQLGPDFGLLCNEPLEHSGDHRALAEIWPGKRRFVVWTVDGVVLPSVEVQR